MLRFLVFLAALWLSAPVLSAEQPPSSPFSALPVTQSGVEIRPSIWWIPAPGVFLQAHFTAADCERLYLQRNLLFVVGMIVKVLLGFFIWKFYHEKKKLRQANDLLQQYNDELTRKKQDLQAQTEQLTRQKVQLEQLNQTKNRLFSLVSHDLRSPVNSLSMLLSEAGEERQEEEIKSLTPLLLPGIQGVQGLLDDLLKWAQAQMNGIRVQPSELNLAELFGSLVQLMQTQASMKNLLLDAKAGDLTMHTDPDMLKTILRNLISNAIKYSHPNHTIRIRAEREGEEILLCIADKGIGMHPDVLDRLFNTRLNSLPGTANECGTGVGLLLCRQYIDALQGRIEVRSALGQGTSFNIRLPLRINARQLPQPVEEIPGNGLA